MPFLNLLITQLRDTFPNCKIYDEPVSSGIELPCFVIQLQQFHEERGVNKQVKVSVNYVLTYLPKDKSEEFGESGQRGDMLAVKVELVSNPVWRYLDEKFHIQNLRTNLTDDYMTIRFTVSHEFQYVLPSEEPMAGVWVGVDTYDPINNPGRLPDDPDNPDNPGNPVDPEDPTDPDGNMGSIIIN